jgi:hypothetical protein
LRTLDTSGNAICAASSHPPGGQDHYFKAISDLAAGGGFTSERLMDMSKTFDTNFPASH